MPIDYVAYVLRLMHILAVITAIGGMVFIRFALLPALESIDEQQRRSLNEAIRARWSRLIQLSILFLLVSGLINFIMFVIAARDWPQEWRDTYNRSYQMLFGIKFLIGLAIFALASILSGRSPGTQKIRDNPRSWLNLNLALALAVVMISGVMRLTHVGPTDPNEPRAVEPASGG
jgi:uncharacterized membrane protein